MFYLGAASYLIFYFGLYELVYKLRKTILSSVKTKSLTAINDDNNFYAYLFLFIALLLTIAISVTFMINPVSLDEIIYGRYTEMIICPELLIGFINLLNKKTQSGKLSLSIIFGFSILTIITSLILKNSGFNIQNCNGICIIGLLGLLILGLPWGIYFHTFMCFAFFRLIWALFTNTKASISKIIITIFLIANFFFISGERLSQVFLSTVQNRMQILEVVDKLNSIEEKLPIYFLSNDPDTATAVMWNDSIIRNRSVADYYQFLLKDRNIKPVNSDQLSKISGEKFVITTTKELDNLTKDKDYSLIGNDEGSYLFVSKVNK